jgi:hypothetical protein
MSDIGYRRQKYLMSRPPMVYTYLVPLIVWMCMKSVFLQMQGNQGGFGSAAQSTYVGANQGSSNSFNTGSSFTTGLLLNVVFVLISVADTESQ